LITHPERNAKNKKRRAETNQPTALIFAFKIILLPISLPYDFHPYRKFIRLLMI
jgi:hypothetical protein